jgi:hypothetical protein
MVNEIKAIHWTRKIVWLMSLTACTLQLSILCGHLDAAVEPKTRACASTQKDMQKSISLAIRNHRFRGNEGIFSPSIIRR